MLHAKFRLPLLSRSLLGAAALALALLAQPSLSQAQRIQPAAEVPVEELMKPSDLPDITIGKADAPVTVIEYSSLTCPHCAHFQEKVFPEFKTKYIDSGKVRFITREFPLDNLAAAASMLTRCVDPAKSFDLVELMFMTQSNWAASQSPKAKLFDIAKQAGFTQESFEKCLTDQALLDKINAQRVRASEKFQINATPTFFVNGKRIGGAATVAEFDKVIEPLLGAK